MNPVLSHRTGAAREALALERTRPFRWLVRAGFIARGLTYGLIGGLAIAVAAGVGATGAKPNQQGALTLIARAPLGKVALVAVAAGLLAYALWKLALGILGHGPEGRDDRDFEDRVSDLASGAVYLAFFAVALKVLIGSAGSQSAEQRRATAGVLGWPGGHVIVAAGGVILIAISAYQAWEAVRATFASDNKVSEMSASERRVFMALGRIGLSARALVFALTGYFLVRTAIIAKPSGVGVDGALAQLHQQPLGTLLLALVAGGLMAFATFSFLEARHQRL